MTTQKINLARQVLYLNRKRDAQFAGRLFSDSGWEIMLAMHDAAEPVSADHISEWVNMPDRVLSRWLELLIEGGLASKALPRQGTDHFELSAYGRASLDAVLSEAALEEAA